MNNKYKVLPIYQEPEGWIVEYPKFAEMADEQMHTFWPWDEPLVENDLQDLRTQLTEAELNGIITVLKLFTLYEMRVGEDYWSGRIARTFKRPEIQRMATMFSAVEFNSHAPFYNKINEILHIDTAEFYNEWKDVSELSGRMKFIAECARSDDDLISIAAFSFIEGAVLYSSFAFIKHFQAQECGKDLLKNICRGINLSVSDENAHALGGALLFRTILDECKGKDIVNQSYIKHKVEQMARDVFDHECGIIDLIFEGDIKGINSAQMKQFVAHRVNLCLEQLGYKPLFMVNDTFIQDWFYKNTTAVAFHDFFSGSGNEYNIDWKEERFGKVWQ